MTFIRRDHSSRAAAALATALVITACAVEQVATDAADSAQPAAAAPAPTAPAPTTPPPPSPPPPGSDEVPFIGNINPSLGWPWVEDLERMAAFPALLDAAFDMGAKEGMRFLAAHSWPDGYTADAMLACRTSEPTPTYAELDADAHRYRVEFRPVSPAPGFQYPPTGEYPADSGLRVYLGRLIVTRRSAARRSTRSTTSGAWRCGPTARSSCSPCASRSSRGSSSPTG
jgi:pyruvate/2-oxoglutarate dehydrogenase complex dihydrolipoamide acyltransferase (E2) component